MFVKLAFSRQFKATTLNVSGEMKQNEEDEVQTRNDNEKLNHQTEGEEDNTEENSNKSEELRETNSKDSCERLDEEAVTERKEQGGKENKFFSFFTISLKYFVTSLQT